ncbi:MAG: hypothetical protein AAF721_27650 [Myxococcota bacterium]
MPRTLLLCAVSLIACSRANPPAAPATVAPSASPTVTAAPTPEPVPEVAAPDVTVAANNEGIVFMRTGETCEAWQFAAQGARLEWAEESGVGLALSYRSEVRGPGAVVLDDPRGTQLGATVALDCPAQEEAEDLLYLEAADCESQKRAIRVERGCPSALLDASARGAILHRLEAERHAATRKSAEDARALQQAFDKRLKKSRAVFRRDPHSGETCVRWAWQRARRRTDDDRLIRRLPGGGTTSHGFYTSVSTRLGRAEVNLVGSDTHGPGDDDVGTIGLSEWQVLILTELTDDFAVVDGKRWYFDAARCRADAGGQ